MITNPKEAGRSELENLVDALISRMKANGLLTARAKTQTGWHLSLYQSKQTTAGDFIITGPKQEPDTIFQEAFDDLTKIMEAQHLTKVILSFRDGWHFTLVNPRRQRILMQGGKPYADASQ